MVRTRRRFLAATAAAAMITPQARAQVSPVRVLVVTGQGQFTLELAADKAPLTCANFLRYVDKKRYDGATLYRALRNAWDPKTGLLQGGLRGDPAKVLPPVAHEPTTQTGLTHTDGVVSLARWAPGTGTSDVFFCLGDNRYLDANPQGSGDNLGFAAFARVTEGMEVIRAVHALPTSPTAGEGVMKGQMLEGPVPVVAMRRTA